MRKLLFIILAVCLALTSCAKGKSPIERNEKEKNVSFTDADFDYNTVDKVSEMYPEALNAEYKHFSIRSDVQIDKIKSVKVLSFKQSNGFLFDIEQGLIDYLNGGKIDIGEKIEGVEEMGAYHQMNADGNYPYFIDFDGGSIVWIKNGYSESFFLPNDNITIERYFFSNSFDDKKYQLKDCEMSINEAIAISRDFASALKEYGYPELSPYEIRIDKQNGTYAFEINMVQKNNNIPLRAANCGFAGRTSSSKDIFTGKLKEINSNPCGYTVLICSSDGVECFRNNENVFEVYEQEEVNEIITLRSALEYIDDNLSENSNYEVEYIGLENKIFWNDPATNLYYSTPMWTISLYNPTEEKYYYALLDCISGDFSFYGQ
ncbi:hypothetical protein [Ruminococcus albus]|uniref:Conserved domain protein n=1 Tax=Ruminococcus albus 8 TaxID=246199 RepID=E9SCN4_RUMAL|nr:hypothetical protein [Ruminococcus albus]EGC02904.1 conserved domain protein [Ruminococcus albus 8]MCC3352410.1 hypothetical protein [Ruminococcus albus 8]